MQVAGEISFGILLMFEGECLGIDDIKKSVHCFDGGVVYIVVKTL